MRTLNKKRAALMAGTAAAVAPVVVGPGLPAAAEWPTVYRNNGCEYSYITGDGGGNARPSVTVWQTTGGNGCSGGWVQLHYYDANKNARVATARLSWPYGDGLRATVASGTVGGTFRFSCASARSTSHGNWSVVRQHGSGTCGSP